MRKRQSFRFGLKNKLLISSSSAIVYRLLLVIMSCVSHKRSRFDVGVRTSLIMMETVRVDVVLLRFLPQWSRLWFAHIMLSAVARRRIRGFPVLRMSVVVALCRQPCVIPLAILGCFCEEDDVGKGRLGLISRRHVGEKGVVLPQTRKATLD